MSDWTAGYVADIGYTYGYYHELNPQRIKLAFLNAGLAVPDLGAACELGYGQGLSINLHAAAAETKWHGTDFNPSQAGFAQELSAAAGVNAHVVDDAFLEYAKRDDLPHFDFIGLHGIWSWISDENRHAIVEFIQRKLKVGGVLYISYNTLPGWSTFAPMRHLMTEHAEIIGAEGHGIVSRINGALDFAEKMLATNPGYARANPVISERLKLIKSQNRHYLAHEYFNRDWHPMHFATMADWLEPAKLQYACSAHYLDHVDAVNLTADQQQFLREIADTTFRESVRDFMVNQQFRRDYWVRGARKITPVEQVEGLRKLQILMVVPREEVALKIKGLLGEAELNSAVYSPLLDLMQDHKPRSIGQVEQAVRDHGVNFSQLMQALMILMNEQKFSLVQDARISERLKKHCNALNSHLIGKARSHGEINYLASPVTGGGVIVPRFHQLFLLAISNGHEKPAEWAAFVWNLLKQQSQKLMKEGITLETDQENLAELTLQASAFAEQQLQVLKVLKIL